MRNVRLLEEMAGLRRSRAERVAERQIQRFRRQQMEAERMMLLVDKVREREAGKEGSVPMPFAKQIVSVSERSSPEEGKLPPFARKPAP
jgi:hypothetical protein